MAKTEDYNTALLMNILKKLNQQDVKINMILEYISDEKKIDNKTLTGIVLKKIKESDINSWNEVNDIIDSTNDNLLNLEDDEFLNYLKKIFDKGV